MGVRTSVTGERCLVTIGTEDEWDDGGDDDDDVK